jgi:hypothetical protein
MPRGKKSEESQAMTGKKKGRIARRYYCQGAGEDGLQEFLTLEEVVEYMMTMNEEYRESLEGGNAVQLPIYFGVIRPFNKPLKISKKIEFDKD